MGGTKEGRQGGMQRVKCIVYIPNTGNGLTSACAVNSMHEFCCVCKGRKRAHTHNGPMGWLVTHTPQLSPATVHSCLCVDGSCVWAFGQISEALVCFGVRVVVRRQLFESVPFSHALDSWHRKRLGRCCQTPTKASSCAAAAGWAWAAARLALQGEWVANVKVGTHR